MSVVLVAWINGLIYALLALGVYLSVPCHPFRRITVDGSIAFGGAVTAVLLTDGFHPLLVTPLAFLAGLARARHGCAAHQIQDQPAGLSASW